MDKENFDKMIKIVCNSGERDKAIREAGNIIYGAYLSQDSAHYKAAADLYDAGWRRQIEARWIIEEVWDDKFDYAYTKYYKCSNCAESGKSTPCYCPHCGAKMSGRR